MKKSSTNTKEREAGKGGTKEGRKGGSHFVLFVVENGKVSVDDCRKGGRKNYLRCNRSREEEKEHINFLQWKLQRTSTLEGRTESKELEYGHLNTT